jgi:ATP-dependent Lhr-like helicase
MRPWTSTARKRCSAARGREPAASTQRAVAAAAGSSLPGPTPYRRRRGRKPRTRAIRQGPDDLGDAATLSIITVDAIDQVRAEAWIRPRNADELHDGLLQLGFLTAGEFTSGAPSVGVAGTGVASPSAANPGSSGAGQWSRWFHALAEDWRACCVESAGRHWWVATERLAEFRALHPGAAVRPDPSNVYGAAAPERGAAVAELLRGRLSGLGPVTVATLAEDFALPPRELEAALLALQAEGYVMSMACGG